MLVNRLYLRNFRVYEDELDLELPPGLVGIYGPNGAGKSTLLEAIVFTLFGRARTSKDEIRSAGVGGDCVAEVSFEHEGHLYVVRRTLSGINTTVRAEAHADGLLMATGVRDTARYVHSVLGMDDAAFRASVFAEQKQLASFSAQSPAERRRLVLQLLGITPLDAARDTARRDARDTSEQHRRLRSVLPDLDALVVGADDADARAAAAEAVADTEEAALDVQRARLDEAAGARSAAEAGRSAYDALVSEGRTARAELDRASGRMAELEREAAALSQAAGALIDAERRASPLAAGETWLRALGAVVEATRAAEAVTVPAEPAPVDLDEYERAVQAAGEARDQLASIRAGAGGAAADAERARAAAERSEELSGEASCPLCGQALGTAFASVQAHRAAELADATKRAAALSAEEAVCAEVATSAVKTLETQTELRRTAETERAAWERAAGRRADAEATRAGAVLAAEAAANAAVAPAAPQPARCDGGEDTARGCVIPSDLVALEAAHEQAAEEVAAARGAAAEADRLRGRLERRDALTTTLASERTTLERATDAVDRLRRQLKDLDFDPARLAAAGRAHQEAAIRVTAADRAAREARLHATAERARAEGEARRLADARQQHATLATLQTDARHLSRLADLLAEFRNTVVASVGPRLAVQAAELFGELTDHEYDELQVDPETYELLITDGGRVFGLDRFSGSEGDLANLALRVAISEHIRFQSGGSVGLLVLDEVFGPLDDERKARMLQALERLRGRFRQVLVVTHDSEIKDQMPHAVEVVKQPGRRATARLVEG